MSKEVDISEAYKLATWVHKNGPDILVEMMLLGRFPVADIRNHLTNEGYLVHTDFDEKLKRVEIWISNSPILNPIWDLKASAENLLSTSQAHPWELAVAEYLDSLRAAGSIDASELREPEGRSLTFPLKD